MRCTSSRGGLVAGLLIALLLVAACAPHTGESQDRSEETLRLLVRTYNVKLAEAFRRQDMNVLNKVATKDQAYTEYYQMAALGEGKVKLLSTPKSIRFLATVFTSESSATVDAEEVWDYVQVSTETSEVVRTENGVIYRLRYGIVRLDGRWLVDSVKPLPEGDGGDATRRP